MAAIRHAKVSTRNPTADSTAVQPADWNADHVIAADLDVATHKIINVVDPVNAQDAATKQYVDTHGGGGGGISGLTTNTIPKATSSTSIGNGSITDTAGTVDINASAIVESNLTVQGTSTLVDAVTAGNGLAVTGATSSTGNITTTGGRIILNPGAAVGPMVDWKQTGQTEWQMYQAGSANPLNLWNSAVGADITTWASTGAITHTKDLSLSGTNPLVLTGARHISPAILTAPVVISNTETVIKSMTIPANTLVAGSMLDFGAFGRQTTGAGTNTFTIRLRVGPITLTGTTLLAEAKVDSSQLRKQWQGTVTFRTVGASGGMVGHWAWTTPDGGGYDLTDRGEQPTAQTIDTTVSNLVEITFISGNAGNTYTWDEAFITMKV